MYSKKVKKYGREEYVLFHRVENGNDIVTTNENRNIFYGAPENAPTTADFVVEEIDNKVNYYYKSKDINNNLKWQKIYLRGEDNG